MESRIIRKNSHWTIVKDLYIAPYHLYILVSIWSVHLMEESKRMEKFMDDNLDPNTAWSQTQLQSSWTPIIVEHPWKIGIASSISRNYVHIVKLISTRNKDNTGVVLDVHHPSSYDVSLLISKCSINSVVQNTVGPTVAVKK